MNTAEKRAVILHGKPSKEQFFDKNFPSISNYYWLPWMQKQLAIIGIPTWTPEVPNGWIDDYQEWKKEFERYDIDSDTLIIGHSCGSGFIVRWLSENPQFKTGRVILTAPWIDPDREHTTDFFDFKLNPKIIEQTKGIIIINSSNDFESIQKTCRILKDAILGIKYIELEEQGHFYDENKMEFPELLDEVTGLNE